MLDLRWVIRDDSMNFVKRDSIFKDDDSWVYVCFKSFTPECRCYTNINRAKEALEQLNMKSVLSNLNISFHLEEHTESSIERFIEIRNGIEESMIIKEISISPKVNYAK